MDLGLKGKVAIVAGASNGIGRATAEVLAEEGCRVAICSRRLEPLEAVRDEIVAKTGAEVYAASCDLANPDQINRFVNDVIDRFGTVHALVNNGPLPPWGDLFDELPDEEWISSWESKFLGYVRLARAVLPVMRAQKWGRIVLIGGMAGRQPGTRYPSGSTIHAATPNLAKLMSETYGPDNVLVTNVSPGPIKTKEKNFNVDVRAVDAGLKPEEGESLFLSDVALRRYGTSREVADVVAFLCSERASYVTGTDILVDGGRSRGL